MMSKFASSGGLALLLAAGAVQLAAQGPSPPPRETGAPSACADLTRLSLPNGTTITAASLVSGGTLAVSPTSTLSNLPTFCRVQGVSKPSPDSNIQFEVWLPQPAAWNSKFLSSGEGGFAGTLNYSRNGLDGGLDELVRRGYATASTDTGHVASDTWWAIGHPEKVPDYLVRSRRIVTVAQEGVIQAFYGRPQRYPYFSSCSNGGRQGLLEAQRY